MFLRHVALVCLAATAACSSPASRPTPVPAPASAPRTGSGIPAEIGRYRLTATEAIEPKGDSLFRFSDGSPVRLTVFRYAVAPDVRVAADSQSWTSAEGMKFEAVQPYRVSAHQIDEYKVAFADTAILDFGDARVTEHSMAVAVKSRGTVMMDFQYLYLIRGRFLKVRATVPADDWMKAEIPGFARELARRVHSAG